MKWFLGPMSKNIVDTVIKFSLKNPKLETHFIPSRRQIEYSGGYVNYWKTADFCEYVKIKNPNICIQRDHSGPGQGSYDDDGYESLKEDCKYMDMIHIDPWKKYSTLEDGIKWTIDMLQYCDKLNPNLQYEIGTEESIRPFSVEDLEYIIMSIKDQLSLELFNKIKYLVIQCGTGLCEGNNTGTLNKDKLISMIKLSKKYNLIAKEHNGDWVSSADVEEKSKLGLSHINIAPELAEIETKVILRHIKNNLEDYENIYQLCYNSGKWKKWVSTSFIPEENKEALILFSCHYIYATPEFQKIIKKYSNINLEIKDAIYNKLLELYNIYTVRTKCLFCNETNFKQMYDKDYITTLSQGFNKNILEDSYFMPYNILTCNNCKTVQTKYLGNLNIIYSNNHIDSFGITKNKMHLEFTNFITQNNDINGIIEIGACSDALANDIISINSSKYYIIDPSYTGLRDNITVIDKFIEDADLSVIHANTILMSNLFEHIYEPVKLLEHIVNCKTIKYIYLNHPDFEYAVKNNIYCILNSEHIFYIEHSFLINFFENNGFILNRRNNFDNHTEQFEFIRNDIINNKKLLNINSEKDIQVFFDRTIYTINSINSYIDKGINTKFYIWPASAYSIPLFTFGLNYKKITGLLDNSPNKIGKYLYGYNLQCSSFNEVVEKDEIGTCIIISGAGSYCKEINIQAKNIKVININNLDDLKDL